MHASIIYNIDLCRKKFDANPKLSDKELFCSLPMGDIWEDGDMTTVFVYLMDHKQTVVPDSWLDTMIQFRHDLLEATGSDARLVDRYNDLVAMH